MKFDDYQKQARTTLTVSDDNGLALPAYLTLGLVGETGEIAEKVKKIIRNEGGDFSKLDREDIKRELGDVLWYLSAFAGTFDISLDDIASTNLQKLFDRQKRDAINSTGDYR